MKTKLFSALKIREIEFKNRIFVSPMCQYSAIDGIANEWHFVHLGSRAVGGAGLIIAEFTAVSPEGRITPYELGLWKDEQINPLKKITKFIEDNGSVPGIQIAHAGRKASTARPWEGGHGISINQGGWETLGPSAVSFSDKYSVPREMTRDDIKKVTEEFRSAAIRGIEAGFKVIEIHGAHGYLLHQFLSPLSNNRTDEYGGPLKNRMRFPLEVSKTVRENIPEKYPLFFRISATDWAEGGFNPEEAVVFCKELKKLGIDFIDCSSGGQVPYAKIQLGPGYQVPFAEKIKKEAAILTGAVGLINEPEFAEEILQKERADAVLMARAFLRNPYWPLTAASKLGEDIKWPDQYLRAKQ